MGSKSVNIAAPTNASYQTAFDDVSKLFWFMPPTYSQQTVQITYSTEQSLLDLGINYGFLAGNLAAKFQTINTNGNTTLYMVVKNVYFNTSVEYPSNPAGFFGQNVNVSDLKRLINEDNAPAYISNISYGRVALVKLVSSYAQREVKASVELVLRGLGASLTAGQKSLVSELQLTVEAAPGPSYVLKTLDDVYKFMDEGSQFNHRNGCVPVGYEARYLKNNSILMTHTGISYKINDCL
jgi:thiol-activated cytolysin